MIQALPATCCGDLNWVPDSWLQPDLTLAVAETRGMNQQLEALSSLSLCFSAFKQNEN